MTAWTAGMVGAYHEMTMCETGEINTKAGQEHLSVSSSLNGGSPSFDGGFNLGQIIAGNLAGVPTGLPKFTGCSGDRRIEIFEGAGIRYRRGDVNWLVWPRDPRFHCKTNYEKSKFRAEKWSL